MEYGFNIPTRGPLAKPDDIVALAQRGEQLGFSYILVPDHIVIPRDIESRYPYTQTGALPGSAYGECLEQLSVMAYLAAATSKIRLLTSVMVVPHRNPVLAAKILATIDVLSKGRVTVGCGTGWMKEEFDAVGVPPFEERGRVTDEYVAIFKELWTSDDPNFDGDYGKFSNVSFLPRPVQKPHPPIWIGGESRPALRRAVRFGDAWYPIGANPAHPLDTPARYQARLNELKQIAEDSGRDPDSIELAYWANWYDGGAARRTDDGERHMFTGTADDLIGDIEALRSLGVSKQFIGLPADNRAEALDHLERFATDVMQSAASSA